MYELEIKTALLITLIININNRRNRAKYTKPVRSFLELGATGAGVREVLD